MGDDVGKAVCAVSKELLSIFETVDTAGIATGENGEIGTAGVAVGPSKTGTRMTGAATGCAKGVSFASKEGGDMIESALVGYDVGVEVGNDNFSFSPSFLFDESVRVKTMRKTNPVNKTPICGSSY